MTDKSPDDNTESKKNDNEKIGDDDDFIHLPLPSSLPISSDAEKKKGIKKKKDESDGNDDDDNDDKSSDTKEEVRQRDKIHIPCIHEVSMTHDIEAVIAITGPFGTSDLAPMDL